MNDLNKYWSQFAIQISRNSPSNSLRVGAVLISQNNSLISTAFSGELGFRDWSECLIAKLHGSEIKRGHRLFVTINTVTSDGVFSINRLLNQIPLEEIVIGLPDPNIDSYKDTDPVICYDNVVRYSDRLQREILDLNNEFYQNSTQNIKSNTYYATKRIGQLVLQKLHTLGYSVTKEELDTHKSEGKLSNFLSVKYQLSNQDSEVLVKDVLMSAFNEKYGQYNYCFDARSFDDNWVKTTDNLLKTLDTGRLKENKVLNVGVGSGNEARHLFSDFRNITFVDIAPDGIEKVKQIIPHGNFLVTSATDLSSISTDSVDTYISLRTFNSSFFDCHLALKEALRVMRQQAQTIISVANGFLCLENESIIPGLILPGTDFVDIYRGINLIREIKTFFQKENFSETTIVPTLTEIFLLAHR